MNITQEFRSVLREEAKAVVATAKRLRERDIVAAVKLIARCNGKIIALGVGKSGLVVRKIAATLTSTGTTAIYMHAADALHGDLGVISSRDVIMLISNSGETDEILAILPHLKHRRVKILAIVGKLDSTLARNADVVLDASIRREACPLNLAPTSSTTVALALGDALAMTVAQLKGLTAQDFAVNHPSGQLGKRLTLRVADLMHTGKQNPMLLASATWMDVVDALAQYRLGAVNVVGDKQKLIGIVTDGDLRRAIQKFSPAQWARLTCKQMMTPQPTTTTPDTLAYRALQIMEHRPTQIAVLPVVAARQTCVGLLRLHNLVQAGL